MLLQIITMSPWFYISVIIQDVFHHTDRHVLNIIKYLIIITGFIMKLTSYFVLLSLFMIQVSSYSIDLNCPKVVYSPNGRFLVQETYPKTLPRFVLILISLQRWQHRARNETKHFVSLHLIGPQLHQHDLASK